jgi:hypothetical protein
VDLQNRSPSTQAETWVRSETIPDKNLSVHPFGDYFALTPFNPDGQKHCPSPFPMLPPPSKPVYTQCLSNRWTIIQVLHRHLFQCSSSPDKEVSLVDLYHLIRPLMPKFFAHRRNG